MNVTICIISLLHIVGIIIILNQLIILTRPRNVSCIANYREDGFRSYRDSRKHVKVSHYLNFIMRYREVIKNFKSLDVSLMDMVSTILNGDDDFVISTNGEHKEYIEDVAMSLAAFLLTFDDVSVYFLSPDREYREIKANKLRAILAKLSQYGLYIMMQPYLFTNIIEEYSMGKVAIIVYFNANRVDIDTVNMIRLNYEKSVVLYIEDVSRSSSKELLKIKEEVKGGLYE